MLNIIYVKYIMTMIVDERLVACSNWNFATEAEILKWRYSRSGANLKKL